ncbi:hypothetical protein [Pseudomonas sp. BN411]|uniref:hypothetical protein n=1 Tax=Pseudomonas sp. BN411 TaxID=2567887 RepID=UPI002457FAB1|nr:hypothetical protein [Pseudomonas sp. BN411]
MILWINGRHLSWNIYRRVFSELFAAVGSNDYVRVRQFLRETVNGYTFEEEIVDWIHQ